MSSEDNDEGSDTVRRCLKVIESEKIKYGDGCRTGQYGRDSKSTVFLLCK